MARALQGSTVVLLAWVLLLATAAPSFVASKQNLSGNYCHRTFRNCARCTPGYKECAVCEYGYELHARTRKMCTEDLDGPRCTGTFWKCVKCNAAFKSCRECAYGFKVDAKGGCCEDLSGRKCRALFPNCATCTSGFRGCQRCHGGFELKGKTCQKKTLQPDDLSGPKCKALDAKCALCTTGFKSCAQCAPDYAIDDMTKKCAEDLWGSKCRSRFTNCATCTTGFQSCTQCATDYVMDANTKECVEDLWGPKCQSLFTNCSTCKPKFQACAACAGSFVLNPVVGQCEDVKNGVCFAFSEEGGFCELAGVATINFRGGSFDAATRVHVEVVDDAAAERLYNETAVFFEPQQRSRIVTVTVGDQQPREDATVTLAIPAAVASNAGSSEEARVMYLNKWQSDIATLGTWEVTDDLAYRFATVRSVTATLSLTAFYTSETGKYVASLLLVTTNTRLGFQKRRLLQAGVCSGVSLKRPVDAQFSIPPNGRYGPQNLTLMAASNLYRSSFHRGVDFAAPLGTPVSAAIFGKVELGSQDGESGWGHYIIIRGVVGTTLYAHLDKALVKDGDVVKAGELIGVSGKSSTSSGSHLHFEYAPAGKYFDKSSKVDPEPCLDDTAVGSISVGIRGFNGTFEVKFENQLICQIYFGASNTCTLGAMRWGYYGLSFTCLDSWNGEGRIEVSILAPNMDFYPTRPSKLLNFGMSKGGVFNQYLLVD